jgi:hypothetical protein
MLFMVGVAICVILPIVGEMIISELKTYRSVDCGIHLLDGWI